MRKLWLGVIGVAAASTANAAIVTYTMSYNDDGGGGGAGSAPGVFAVYATDTSDNGGIFGLGLDLQGPIDFLGNTLQGVSWKKTTVPTNTKYAGMLAGFATDAAAFKISGLQDLSKGTDMIPVRGLGQVNGDLATLKPDAQHTQFTDLNGNGTVYNSNLLIAVGTVLAGADIHNIKFERTSVDNVASVWQDSSGTGTANFKADLKYVGDVSAQDVFTVAGTAAGTPRATDGKIVVTGSNNKYSSEVDALTSDANSGTASVQTIGDEAGNLYVMAKITGDATAVGNILSQFNNAAADGEAAHLHQLYDSQFDGGSFNLLYRTANFAGAKNVNWDFSAGPNAGAVVDQLAVVPEPATMSLLGLGALGLLARRRRNA